MTSVAGGAGTATELAGTATTQGAKALADAYPSRDAPIDPRMSGTGR